MIIQWNFTIVVHCKTKIYFKKDVSRNILLIGIGGFGPEKKISEIFYLSVESWLFFIQHVCFYLRSVYCSISGTCIRTSTVGDVNTSVKTFTMRGPQCVHTGLIGAVVTGHITSRTFVHVLCTVTSSPTCVTVTFSCDSMTTLTVASVAFALFRTLFSVVEAITC